MSIVINQIADCPTCAAFSRHRGHTPETWPQWNQWVQRERRMPDGKWLHRPPIGRKYHKMAVKWETQTA